MSIASSARTGRTPLAAGIVALGLMTFPSHGQTGTPGQGGDAIRPFHIAMSEGALTDLRRRVAATRWPTKELVEDRSQGVQLATLSTAHAQRYERRSP